jgi:hypothetical protein
MKILYPKPIGVFHSGADGADEYPRWSAQSCAAGAKVIREVAADNAAIDVTALDYIFEAAVDTSDDPASGSLDWINRGVSPAHRIFDGSASTSSAFAKNRGFTISAGKIDGVFLSRFSGAALFAAFTPNGEIFYSQIVSAGAKYKSATSWTSYFFRDIISFSPSRDIFIPLPPQLSTTYITMTAYAGGFSLGKIVVGATRELGITKIAPSIGIMDFSIKNTDDNGATYLKSRSFAKRGAFDLLIETPRFDEIAQLLAEFRARPIVWLADDLTRFSSLAIYGYFRDFSMLLSGEDYSDCNLEIEGLT